MPELAELRLMSDFINDKSKDKDYQACFFVEKGNILKDSRLIEGDFKLSAKSYGKELTLFINDDISISVFMGMSGNWTHIESELADNVKYTRLRFDNSDGYSLLLHGGYLGPKFKVGGFSTKRGYDPTKDFEYFKEDIYKNIDRRKTFEKPIHEALLDQRYFNGIGNYLRAEILYRIDDNPFKVAKDYIKDNPKVLELCRDIPLEAYKLGGGQLKDWENPFKEDADNFLEWLKCYNKLSKIKDSNKRTFWYDPKWKKEEITNNI